MGRLCTPQPRWDPFTTVLGTHGAPYPCPDLATLDLHLAGLAHRVVLAARFPGVVADLRADIDLLLDRRRWLVVAADGPAAAVHLLPDAA